MYILHFVYITVDACLLNEWGYLSKTNTHVEIPDFTFFFWFLLFFFNTIICYFKTVKLMHITASLYYVEGILRNSGNAILVKQHPAFQQFFEIGPDHTNMNYVSLSV